MLLQCEEKFSSLLLQRCSCHRPNAAGKPSTTCRFFRRKGPEAEAATDIFAHAEKVERTKDRHEGSIRHIMDVAAEEVRGGSAE